mmetsp:Transcript_14664/g.27735  ORF Transcript_14664/g.27735 Transcript_14664/m.27735 type:complete len:249 (-) Transcript_14664:382-1128(-)
MASYPAHPAEEWLMRAVRTVKGVLPSSPRWETVPVTVMRNWTSEEEEDEDEWVQSFAQKSERRAWARVWKGEMSVESSRIFLGGCFRFLLWSSSSSTFLESCLGGYSKLAQHKCRGVFPSPSRMLCNTPISLESLGINRIISTAKAGGAFQAATWRTVPPSRGCGRESWAAISSRWACARRWARWARREGQRAFWRVWWRGEMRRSASRSSSLSSSLSSLWSLSSLSSLWSLSSLSGWEKVDGGRELR